MILKYNIEQNEISVKRYLEELNIPDHIFKEIRRGNGQFLVNDQSVYDYYMMKQGDELIVVMPESTQGENIVSIMHDLEILYEDSYLLILNKPANMVTIPTKEYFTSSLANYVMSYYKRKGIVANIHFVSRLDSATSGIIMLAKNSYIHHLLQNTLIIKKYLLETLYPLKEKEGIITGRIDRDPSSIIRRMLVDGEPNSKTVYKVIDERDNHSIVEALLCTGKTHQLRIHFNSLGTPIIGDELYGVEEPDHLLHLHSYSLTFIHPVTHEEVHLETYPTWYNMKK